jgi:hypothetical protein
MEFFYCTEELKKIWNKYDVYFSEQFCNYFSRSIKEILYREAALKPSHKVSLSLFKQHNDKPMYEIGLVSRINTAVSILPEFIGNISFCWKSKSGLIVHTYDEEFEETDLECWIEGLQPKLYWEQLTTVKIDHPLKLKNLPYELNVFGIAMHMGLIINLTDTTNAAEIIKQLAEEVEKHNKKSEIKERAYGVVHNCFGELKGNEVLFRIDVGSAGVVFVKKLLRLLAKFPEVREVTVDI